MKTLEWSQKLSNYKSMVIFPANSTVGGLILPNFELIRDFMVVLVACKNKEEPIQNEGDRVVTRFSPL